MPSGLGVLGFADHDEMYHVHVCGEQSFIVTSEPYYLKLSCWSGMSYLWILSHAYGWAQLTT